MAAETVSGALAHPPGPVREQVLHQYPTEMNRRRGRYYRLGNMALDLLISGSGFHPVLSGTLSRSPFLPNTFARPVTNLSDTPSRDTIDPLLNGLVCPVPAPQVRHH